jgi:hypothetical protein
MTQVSLAISAEKQSGGSRILRAGEVLAGALLLTWPALYNRYPLLYPDAMSYLEDGRLIARALFLHKFSAYYGLRSHFYSLGIGAFHWSVTPWPIVALQAFLAAYVVWLVVRSLLPRPSASGYLLLMVMLSLLTSVSWYTSLILPDILGPVLYLCIYLLVFSRETLSPAEHVAVTLIAWWAVTSHATHMMLAAGLCLLLALLMVIWRRLMQGRWKGVGELAAIILLATAAQVVLNTFLYGEPSLYGERPPFLMARVVADGPGRWYLQQHCGQVKLVVCDYVHRLPNNADDFLWGDNGIWQSASDEKEKRFRREEIPFVLATLRAYPRAQLFRSAANFWQQLTAFGLWDLDENDWVLGQFDDTLPGQKSRYLAGRQARNALPLEFFTSVHNWTVLASLLLMVLFGPLTWRRLFPRAAGLGVSVVSTVLANAFVTGALSTVEDRYQSRVIWLLPLLASVLVLIWFRQRHEARAARPGL